MPVEIEGETYRCNFCGNEVQVVVAGGGTLSCCSREMEKTDTVEA